MTDSAPAIDEERPSARPWLGFSFMALALLVVALDISVTDVAVPSIVQDLGVSADDASLVVTVYLVVAASFMVLMGKVSDLVGPRRALLVGACIFAIGSAITGAAPNFDILLLGRIVQALVVAAVIPASLSLLNHEFPGGRPRVLAFSIWTAVMGSAMALGPLVGGFLSTYASWRWAFFINVPIMLIAVIGCRATVAPVDGQSEEGGFDVLGSALLVVGLALIVFGLQEAPSLGWWEPLSDDMVGGVPWPLPISATPVLVAVGAVLLVFFAGLERARSGRGHGVVLELRLFQLPAFTWGTLGAAFMTAAVIGVQFVIPLYSQYVLDGDPLSAGIALLPLGIGMAIGGPIVSRLGLPLIPTVLVMLIIQPIATLAMVPFISTDGQGWWLAPAMIIDGFAWGAAFSILVALLLADVPKRLSGVAGGTQTAARLLFGAIGGAMLTSILLGSVAAQMASVDESDLTAQQQMEIQQLYTFSSEIHPPTTDSGDTVNEAKQQREFRQVYDDAREDMATGVRLAVAAAAVLSLFGALAGWRLAVLDRRRDAGART